MELLGINPLWVFVFPLVVVVGYAVVLISAYKANKAEVRVTPVEEKPVTEADFDA